VPLSPLPSTPEARSSAKNTETETGTPYSDIGGRGLARLCRSFIQVDWIKCITNRLLHAARREAGITLIETVFAIAIFGTVGTSLIGMLTSATVADGRARQKTIALELAQQQVEYIRQLNFSDVGTQIGNPPGVVVSSTSKRVMGLWYTLTTRIRWVNDPVPTSFATYANYKQVRVTVARASDNTRLARIYTYLSNSTRASQGGVNNSIINVTVMDFALNAPLQGATVNLWDGLSPNASDVTDETGIVTFPALTESPSSGQYMYYDVTASLTGYQTAREYTLQRIKPSATIPPGDSTVAENVKAGHVSLAPSETLPVTLMLYKPAKINILLNDSTGAPYSGTACVTIGAPGPDRGAQKIAVTGGSATLDTIDGEKIVPSPTYRVGVGTAAGMTPSNACTTAATTYVTNQMKVVPDDYPNNVLSSTFTLQIPSTFTTTLKPSIRVTVRKSCPSGTTVANARVDISDPYYMTDVTNSSGYVTFSNVPYATTYDVSAWGSGLTGTLSNQTVSATLPSGSPPNICIPVTAPPS
jgi:type II secretory pathway pseudopilin PulG